MCTEGFSALLRKAEHLKLITGISIRSRCPSVSHLLFVDDSFLFFKATEAQCHIIQNILRTYEQASGQAVNLRKSGIFFSSNVFDIQKIIFSNILEVFTPLDHSRYLGVPSMVGSDKKTIFNFIRDKLWKRIQHWKNKFLSRASKEILLKAVAQAIPAYCMSVFLLPVTLCDELQRMMNSFWWGMKEDGRSKIRWLRWDRMCEKKSNGGLGFRNLRCFNLAMLAKQGWRLMTNQNSLLYRIYKGRYFPNGEFLTAALGHSPSFTWRGIHQAATVLKGGLRWRVGNGTNIRVQDDAWLPRDHAFHTATTSNINNEMMVSDLRNSSGTSWDSNKVRAHLTEEDANIVLAIPLSSSPDKLIWHFNKRGLYTVKSGYYVASYLNRQAEIVPEINWQKVWKLNTPPKVREFMWRSLRKLLPTKQRLAIQGVNINTLCGCSQAEESIEHVIFACSNAPEVWHRWGKLHNVDGTSSFNDLFQLLCSTHQNDIIDEYAMIAWRIWWARNERIWNNTSVPANIILQQAIEHRKEWIDARQNQQTNVTQQQTNTTQHHHINTRRRDNIAINNSTEQLPDWVCDIDAAMFPDRKLTGTAAVFRSSTGTFTSAITTLNQLALSPMLAEVASLRVAVQHAAQNYPGKGLIRTDALGIVQLLNNLDPDWSELGTILSECRSLLQHRSNIDIIWISRSRNHLAHTLARNSISFSQYAHWSSVPFCIADRFEH